MNISPMNYLLHIFILTALLSFSGLNSWAQTEVSIFKEDFGGNIKNDPLWKDNNAGYHIEGYTYVNWSDNNNNNMPYLYEKRYFITKEGSPHLYNGTNEWTVIYDHSSPDDKTMGYFMQMNIDQNEQGGTVFYSKTVSAPPTTNLKFSVWLARQRCNSTEYCTTATLQAVAKVDGVEMEPIQETVEIWHKGGIWQEYEINFSIPENTEAVTISIISNKARHYSESLSIDDIELTGIVNYPYHPGSIAFESSNLPIVSLKLNEGLGKDKTSTAKAGMRIIQNTDGTPNFLKDTDLYNPVTVDLGYLDNTSLDSSPKKSFTINTSDVNILTTDGVSKWKLIASHNDKSLMRTKLIYELLKRSNSSIYIPTIEYCELVIDGVYHGVYLLVAEVPDDCDYLQIGTDDGSGFYSNYFNQDLHGNELNEKKTYYRIKHTNSDLANLITKIQTFEDIMADDSYIQYVDYIDEASLIDYILMQELTRNIEGYRLGTCFYIDNTGKIKLVLDEFEYAMGNTNDADAWASEGWAWNFNQFEKDPTVPFWFKRILANEEFRNKLFARWQELRFDSLKNADIAFQMEVTWKEIIDARARDFKTWGIGEFDEPVNSKLSLEAINVFNFLKKNYGVNTISGVMTDYWSKIQTERVKRIAGKYPALAGYDYMQFSNDRSINPKGWMGAEDGYNNISVQQEWWDNNGLITIMWHWGVPLEKDSVEISDPNYKNHNDAGRPVGWEDPIFNPLYAFTDETCTQLDSTSYEFFIMNRDMNHVANFMKKLQDAKIPILWRPFHEGEGWWFWWGQPQQNDPERKLAARIYRGLWKMMYDKFTVEHELNNLLWVWTSNDGPSKTDALFYPGDEYVDFVAVDKYCVNDPADMYTQFTTLQKRYPNKMISIGECGNHCTQYREDDTAYASDQMKAGAKWSWFMVWWEEDIPGVTDEFYDNDNHCIHGRASWWKDAFSDPNIISRDMMPSLKVSDTDMPSIVNDEYEFLKNWLLKRSDWLDSRLTSKPVNYVANASFDSDKEDAPNLSNWRISDPTTINPTTINPKSGDQSLLFKGDGQVAQTVTELPERIYKLSLSVLNPGNQTCKVSVRNSSGIDIYTEEINNTNNIYKEITIPNIKIDSNAYDIIIVVENNTGSVYIDDIILNYDETKWIGNSNDWIDDLNWSNGIPTKLIDIVLPEGLSHYPILKESDEAKCNTITFGMGASLVRTDYLDYNSAKVDLSVLPNRWYMVSAPLGSMYSGDYFVEGHEKRQFPAVYMMKYQSKNPETQTPALVGEFSNPFNTLDEKLHPGLGYTIWVDDGNESGENVELQPFSFPKDDKSYELWDYGGNYIGTVAIPERDKIGRFTYEDAKDTTETGFTLAFKEDSEDYSTLMIGNPFMSHLDFKKFAETNSEIIDGSGYYLWTPEETFEAISPVVLGTNEIPPMQSFIVVKQENIKIEEISFEYDMAVPAKSSNNVLRSSVNSFILRMDVLREEIPHSNIWLKYDPAESNEYNSRKDMWTLFSETSTDPAVLYAVVDKKAVSIRTLGDVSQPIELGIRTDVKGPLTLRLSGYDKWDSSYDIYLEDRLTGESKNLGEIPEYTLNNQTGNIQGRLFLKIKEDGGITGKENISFGDSQIRIYTAHNEIKVTSSVNDPIESVKIYSLQGNVLCEKQTIGQSYFSISLHNTQPMIIVAVTTKYNQKQEKVIM